MRLMDILIALHVLGIVWWIGGVAMVTTVYLPMVHHLPEAERLGRVREIERRFAWQARIAVLLVGLTGFWMLSRLGGTGLLRAPQAWWLDLMIFVWGLFAAILFLVEPFGVMERTGLIRNRTAFLLLHAVLLALALAAVICGVLGVRGGFAS